MPDAKVVWHNDGNKLSDVIDDFAKPLLEKCSDFAAQKQMRTFAMLAWNLCVAPKSEADKLKEKLYKDVCKNDAQAVKDMNEVMDYFIARKEHFFKDDKRFIVSYSITNSKDGLHLQVAYPTNTEWLYLNHQYLSATIRIALQIDSKR